MMREERGSGLQVVGRGWGALSEAPVVVSDEKQVICSLTASGGGACVFTVCAGARAHKQVRVRLSHGERRVADAGAAARCAGQRTREARARAHAGGSDWSGSRRPCWVSSTNYRALHICCHPTGHRVCSGTAPTHTHTQQQHRKLHKLFKAFSSTCHSH